MTKTQNGSVEIKTKEAVLYLLLAFVGGNTTGGIAFNLSGNTDVLKRIEYKLDKMQYELDRAKDEIRYLKIQVKSK